MSPKLKKILSTIAKHHKAIAALIKQLRAEAKK